MRLFFVNVRPLLPSGPSLNLWWGGRGSPSISVPQDLSLLARIDGPSLPVSTLTAPLPLTRVGPRAHR